MHAAGSEAYEKRQQDPIQLQPQLLQQGLPEALSYLAQIDQILVKQKIEATEVLTGWESKNKYLLLNTMGQQIFSAKEKSGSLERWCYGSQRAFEMLIFDNNEQEVIHVSRPYKCLCLDQSFSCMECCLDLVTVEAPPGRVVGTVKQVRSDWRPRFEIRDAADQLVLQIRGPHYCHCHCAEDIPFSVLTADGSQEVGRVSKQWTNLMQEYFTDADNFGITFPMDLNLDIKATIIGACFLIDFMFFEDNEKD